MPATVLFIQFDFEDLVVRNGELVESEHKPVASLALDLRMELILIDGLDGGLLLDGILPFLLVPFEAFHKLDVVVDIRVVLQIEDKEHVVFMHIEVGHRQLKLVLDDTQAVDVPLLLLEFLQVPGHLLAVHIDRKSVV